MLELPVTDESDVLLESSEYGGGYGTASRAVAEAL